MEENFSVSPGTLIKREKRLITKRGKISPKVAEDSMKGTVAKQEREQYSQAQVVGPGERGQVSYFLVPDGML